MEIDHEMVHIGSSQLIQEDPEVWFVDFDLLSASGCNGSGDDTALHINGRL
jgi:hypothetical protein